MLLLAVDQILYHEELVSSGHQDQVGLSAPELLLH